MKIKSALLINLVLCTFFSLNSGISYASESEDYYHRYLSNRFFPTELTLRSLGLGGGFVALKDASLGVVGNPATLGGLSSSELSFTYQYETIDGEDPNTGSNAEIDTHRGLILGSFPVTPQLGIGFGLVPSDGDGDGSPDTETLQVPLGIGFQLNEQFSLGYGIGYYDDEYDAPGFSGENEEAFLHRLGFIYSIDPEVNFGLLGTYGHGDANTNTITGMTSDIDLEQWSIRGGLTWQALEKLLFVADFGYESMEGDGVITVPGVPAPVFVGTEEEIDILTITGGIEYYVNPSFQLRTGVGYNHYDYDTNDPALGAILDDNGLFHWAGGLTYAWTDMVDTDLGVQVRFGDEIDFLTGITTNIKF